MEHVKMSVKVRKRFDYDSSVYGSRLDCGFDLDTGEELVSMTKQSFKDECDINHLMAKYEKTGVLDHTNSRRPEYGDFAGVVSYQDSLNIVLEAREAFAELPAKLRDRFGNDPAQYLAFLENPENKDEAIKLGMMMPPPADPEPMRVEIVNPDPAAPSSSPAQSPVGASGAAGTAATSRPA